MALLALFIGILFIATGLNNTTGQLFDLLGKEFSGSDGKPSFVPWALSILVIGSLGYWDKIQRAANMFLILVMVVLVLVNKGFFSQFTAAFNLPNGGKGIDTSGSGGSIFSDGSSATSSSSPGGILGQAEGVINMFGGSALTGQVNGVLNKVQSGVNIANSFGKLTGQITNIFNGGGDVTDSAGNTLI